MPATLPIELYDLLEKKVGREDAREVGKLILASFDAIDKRAETVVVQKKAEIKEELTKELATKEDLARSEGRLNDRITSLEGRLSERISSLEGRLNERISSLEGKMNEKISSLEGRLNDRITSLEGKMSEKFTDMNWRMKVSLIVIISVILLTNPKSLDLIAKLFGLVK
ncbi:hypothetical protein [Candidatus Magnetominusculus dajiuhuensis]|uniref:hypothetical protein n=1 Tax=Candidatus Magnetominusculus dajiuhuensis TaxID=3137712 RepID=UPI003B42DD84